MLAIVLGLIHAFLEDVLELTVDREAILTWVLTLASLALLVASDGGEEVVGCVVHVADLTLLLAEHATGQRSTDAESSGCLDGRVDHGSKGDRRWRRRWK